MRILNWTPAWIEQADLTLHPDGRGFAASAVYNSGDNQDLRLYCSRP